MMKLVLEFVALSLLIWRSSSQTAAVIPPSLVGVEGENLNVTCSLEDGPRPTFVLRIDGTLIQNTEKLQGAVPTDEGTRFVYGPLLRNESGFTFLCDDQLGNTASATLDVYWNDPFTFNASSTTVNEGDEVNITVTFSASPQPNVSLERQDGNAIPDEEDRIITTNVSNDTSQLTFQDLREQDTGNYSVQVAVPGAVERQPIFLNVVPTPPPPTPTPRPCDEVCIIIIIIVTIAVLIILVVVAAVVTVLLVRMYHKRRQKKSEGEQEDKNVPLS